MSRPPHTSLRDQLFEVDKLENMANPSSPRPHTGQNLSNQFRVFQYGDDGGGEVQKGPQGVVGELQLRRRLGGKMLHFQEVNEEQSSEKFTRMVIFFYASS